MASQKGSRAYAHGKGQERDARRRAARKDRERRATRARELMRRVSQFETGAWA